jgi:hypothetical protein
MDIAMGKTTGGDQRREGSTDAIETVTPSGSTQGDLFDPNTVPAAKVTRKSIRTGQREAARGKIADVADAVGTSVKSSNLLDEPPKSVQRNLIAQAKNDKRVTVKASKVEGAKKSTKSVAPGDTALFDFTARVCDLRRRISKNPPKRFAETAVGTDVLAKLGKFFADLAQLKARATP